MSKYRRGNKEEFLTKANIIHNNIYDYSEVNFYDSKKHITILCSIHGLFSQRPAHHLSGHGCKLCLNKTEGIIYQKLKYLYPDLIQQFKEKWCKKINLLPYDFCISSHNIIIELDGRQHFQQVNRWLSPQEQFENDKFKEKCANENGYSVIRLLQNDVYNNKTDWLTELCDSIEELSVSNKVQNIYLCKNGEYDHFL
jgi:very-short-patch-repair endonuclease